MDKEKFEQMASAINTHLSAISQLVESNGASFICTLRMPHKDGDDTELRHWVHQYSVPDNDHLPVALDALISQQMVFVLNQFGAPKPDHFKTISFDGGLIS